MTDPGTHYQGTGLGMAITKEIVDLMGGTIDVESRVGAGTTFRIKVPFELCADEYVQQKDGGREADISLEHMKILMAEDIKRCRAAGMNDHLAKPLNIQKLYRTLARYHRSAYSE